MVPAEVALAPGFPCGAGRRWRDRDVLEGFEEDPDVVELVRLGAVSLANFGDPRESGYSLQDDITFTDFGDLHTFNVAFDQIIVRSRTKTNGVEAMWSHDLTNRHYMAKHQNNRLSGVFVNARLVAQYTYNGKGQRVIKKTASHDDDEDGCDGDGYTVVRKPTVEPFLLSSSLPRMRCN
jgi:hypothetical protein